MKTSILLLSLLLLSCTKKTNDAVTTNDTIVSTDTVKTIQRVEVRRQKPAIYANERFRNVTVQKVDEHTYRARGEAQIFEANFGWVVEDGHNQLKSGHQMTDAGAPAWGKFDFNVTIDTKEPNTTLHLILFEVSAKDGSRHYELPIPLL